MNKCICTEFISRGGRDFLIDHIYEYEWVGMSVDDDRYFVYVDEWPRLFYRDELDRHFMDIGDKIKNVRDVIINRLINE